jgi:hypothetical protein
MIFENRKQFLDAGKLKYSQISSPFFELIYLNLKGLMGENP